MRGGFLVRGSEAEVLTRDLDSVTSLLADPEHTGGVLTANRALLRAGSAGAPPHYHERSDELLYVIDGELEVLLGEDIVTLGAGDLLQIAPYMPHAFAPVRGKDADVMFIFTPGTPRFNYYRLLDRFHAGEATSEDILASQNEFDNHYLDVPMWTKRDGEGG